MPVATITMPDPGHHCECGGLDVVGQWGNEGQVVGGVDGLGGAAKKPVGYEVL